MTSPQLRLDVTNHQDTCQDTRQDMSRSRTPPLSLPSPYLPLFQYDDLETLDLNDDTFVVVEQLRH